MTGDRTLSRASALLDTHILVWWCTDAGRLTRPQISALSEAEGRGQPLFISAVTLRELARLGFGGRLRLSMPWDLWLEEMESSPLLEILPLTAQIASESVRLGDDFPKDPFDQIIAATARCHGLPLLTADQHIRRWGGVRII